MEKENKFEADQDEELYCCGICEEILNLEDINTHRCLTSESDKENTRNQNIREGDRANIKNWARHEVLTLIGCYEIYKDDMNHPVKRRTAWKKIIDYLNTQGIGATILQAQNKIKSLLRSYKKIIDNNKKTGRGTIKFQYFDEMDKLFGKSKAVHPTNVVSSTKLPINICNLDDACIDCGTVSQVFQHELKAQSGKCSTLQASTSSDSLSLSGSGKEDEMKKSNKRNVSKENPLQLYMQFKQNVEDEKKKARQETLELWKENEKRKAEEKQKRHEERLSIEREKLGLLELLLDKNLE